jgi:FAD/FMN-containing dehydrogenase
MRRQADAASQTKISKALPWRELQRQLAGDLNTDRVARYAHATDASLYQVLPAAVVCPRNVEDCLAVIEFARRHELSITPRAAGTSLAGQAVGSGIIVDMSRYFTRVIDVDLDSRTARVEPGVIIDTLNQQLVSHGLQFAPDPSTLNRCNIGGAIGNNAWGAHAPRDGTMRDHIVAIDAILSSGAPLRARAIATGVCH